MRRWMLALALGLFGWCGPAFAQTLYPMPAQPAGLAFPTQSWPTGPIPSDANLGRFNQLIEEARTGKRPALGETRALVVIHRGRLVFEAYAPGYGAETKLCSWSMAKSFTQGFVGAAVLQGKIANVDAPMGNPRWTAADPKSKITWRQWLQHVDGSRYVEIGAPSATQSDVSQMMFGRTRMDVNAYAAKLPLIHTPGEHWNYSTAASHLVADQLTNVIAPGADAKARRLAMRDWMKQSLLDPIGMDKAVLEFDPTGAWLGGSLVYASARDFAKFGLLYMRDGVWEGKRALPEGWVDFARKPGTGKNADVYGAGWWLNPPTGEGRPMFNFTDTGPTRDAFSAQGHEGQMILLVPSKDLIIVRLGRLSESPDGWRALNGWLGELARTFPAPEPAAAPAKP